MRAEDRLTEAFYGLGHWLIEEDRPRDAVHVFRAMLAHAPEDERSWIGLGRCHELVGESEIAADIYALGTGTVLASFRCPLAHARLLRERGAAAEADQSFDLAERRADEALATTIAAERAS